MSEFTIGSYTIDTSETIYNTLKSENLSDSELKQFDTDNDMIISEDELQEFLEEIDETEEEDDEEESSVTDTEPELDEETLTELEELDEEYQELKQQLSSLTSRLGTASDLDTYTSIQSEIDSVNDEIDTNRMNKYNLLVEAETGSSSTSSTSSSTTSSTTDGTGISGGTDFGNTIVEIAQSYVGKLKESDGSYLEVTNGRAEAWCADFVTYVVSLACEQTGTSLNGFGSASVSTLKAWGEANGCYIDITENSDRAQTIVDNVQPGDIMIMKSNGASHTGIVTKVYSDGSFDTIEGNTSDQCLERHHSASESGLSGFIKIT